MCRYKQGEAMVRVRKPTRARINDLKFYFLNAADRSPGGPWWEGDVGPSADDVINRVLDHFDAWRARRAKAGKARARKAKPAAG